MNNDLTQEQKREIQKVYEKWAKKTLKECKNMTPTEEREYIKNNESLMFEELEKLKEKFSTK